MAQNPPYHLAAGEPFDRQTSTYVRWQKPVMLTAPRSITWQWVSPRPSPLPRCRLWAMPCRVTIDRAGDAAIASAEKVYLSSDWLTGTLDAKYTATVDVPSGDYLLGVDIENTAPWVARAIEVPMRMQRELPVVQTHTAVVQWRHEWGNTGPGSAILPVPAAPPVPFSTHAPLRTATPHNTYQRPDQLWHSHIAPMASRSREFFVTKQTLGTQTFTCLTAHASKEQYKEADIDQPWSLPLHDGPRGVGTTGMVGHIAPRAFADPALDPIATRGKRGWSWWMVATHGRVIELWETGEIGTIFGWRVKPGHFAPDWTVAQDDPAFAKEHCEFVGHCVDFEPGDLKEPWGITVRAYPESDHHGHGVEHEGWVTDTFRHRGFYINHMPAHAPEHYRPAAWAPISYTSPAAPHGQADIVHCFGNRDGTPMGRLCYAPWGLTDPYPAHLPDAEAIEDLIAFTNYWGDSICWANIRTGEITPIWVSKFHLEPSAQEQANNRTIWGIATADALFDTHVGTMDWLPFEQASIIRPAAIDHFSNGDLCVISEGMAAIFRVDWRTRRVKCIKRSTKTGVSLTLSTLAVDWRGEFGPKDHIRYSRWAAGTTASITEDGVQLGYGVPTTSGVGVLEGPANHVQSAGYISSIAMRGGNLVAGDSGTRAFFRLTKKLPTDPTLDTAKYSAGEQAWAYGTEPSLVLTHGQGRLGYPTGYELATWDDARRNAYLMGYGLTETQAKAVGYMLLWDMKGASAAPSPDTTPPPAPPSLTVEATWEGTPPTATLTLRCQQVDDAPSGARAARYHAVLNGVERTVVVKPVDPNADVVLVIDGVTVSAEPAFPWQVEVRAGDAATPENIGAPVTRSVNAADFPDSVAPAIPTLRQGTTLWEPSTLTVRFEADQVLDEPGEPAIEYPIYVNGARRLTAYPPPEMAPMVVAFAIDTSAQPGPYAITMTAQDSTGNESGQSNALAYAAPVPLDDEAQDE